MIEIKEKNLYYLEELPDYQVASDDSDVRGWQVFDRDSKSIGTVTNLLVNINTEKVVYLDVEVDPTIIEANHKPYATPSSEGVHEFLNKDGENHIIIPIGMADLDTKSELVKCNYITHHTFAETKRKTKTETVYRDYEIAVMDTYKKENPISSHPLDDDFYEQEAFKFD
ncbi:PRC-barrel domain-containing protein [Aquimarina sp. ERC-38]|uniref:PRC-barrel domain-containing protein n=1 Tax=Aquimarina sp. ERC-38 TaxID=2949996 RepID=UPI002247D27A|nr:PRC-barrel domain-containing protein [Aquimarina sp. ERC-38]UZO79804.1 PRC-barrel domain-containing protein [Aquimarina sp. ERC-38]